MDRLRASSPLLQIKGSGKELWRARILTCDSPNFGSLTAATRFQGEIQLRTSHARVDRPFLGATAAARSSHILPKPKIDEICLTIPALWAPTKLHEYNRIARGGRFFQSPRRQGLPCESRWGDENSAGSIQAIAA